MEIALILILIVLNGLFAMSEAAMISSRKARIETVAARGSRSAATALRMMSDPTRFLSTTQVGITLIGILSGAIGQQAIANKLQPHLTGLPLAGQYAGYVASFLMALMVGYASLIIGELVPKRLALAAPEAITIGLAPVMRALSLAASPLVKFLSFSTDVVVKLLPIKPAADHEAAEEEVKALIATGTESGVFEQSEQKIVERVFRLSDQNVRSLMVPRTDIVWLPAESDAPRIREALARAVHAQFPICRTGLDDLIGVVHIKDLVAAATARAEGASTPDLSALAQPPMFVPETTPALRLLEMFKESGERMAFVLDEHGVVEGLVTLTDLVEAIVGELSTPDEPHEPWVIRRHDGSYLLDGRLTLDELKKLMGFELGPGATSLPKEDEGTFETLGGWIMAYLGRIPTAGEEFEWDRFRFEVVDMDRQRIDKVLYSERALPPHAADDPQAH